MRISAKHGVNPSVKRCFYCGQDKELILFGFLPGDREAPRTFTDLAPCEECKELMRHGCILVSVANGPERDAPMRTGGWCVLKDEALRRLLDEEMAEQIITRRFAYVPDMAWDAFGLPRGRVEGIPSSMEEYRAQAT